MNDKVVPFRRTKKTIKDPHGGKPIPVVGWMCAKCGLVNAPTTLTCPCEIKPAS